MKTGESGMVNTEGDSRFRLPHRNLLKVAWQGVMVALTLIGVVTAVTENASTEGVSWPARILFAAFSRRWPSFTGSGSYATGKIGGPANADPPSSRSVRNRYERSI